VSTTRRSVLLSAAAAGGVALGASPSSTTAAAAAATVTPVYPSTDTVPLGKVSDAVSLDLSKGATFTCTITGNTVFQFINWPTGLVSTEPTVIATQDGTGHTIKFTGVTWLPSGTPPLFQTGANQVNINCFFSDDNGTTVYGQGGTSPGGGFGVYGDGSDDAAILDGTNTYSFVGKSTNGLYYWLTRDVYLSSLVVAPGITLQLAGGSTATYKLFCSGVASIASTGSIVTYVNASSLGAAAGSNLTGGSLLPGASAPGGGTGAGTAGTGLLGLDGASAGSGGAAKSGATAGGAGGKSFLTSGYSLPRALPWASMVAASGPNVSGTTVFFPGGSGGGAGAGDGSKAGGAGGPGGNPLFIAARNVVNAGAIAAYGGKGGDATGGNAGGGGGGQGGPIMLIYGSYSGSGALVSSGGAGGAGSGSGADGTAGGASWIIRLVN
jgi:hypothetical protein